MVRSGIIKVSTREMRIDSQHSPSTRGWEQKLKLAVVGRTRQGFGEEIRGVVCRGAVGDGDGVVEDALANEVMANVDVFGASVMNVVLG